MPLYEFECDYCGKVFEKFCHDHDTTIMDCPFCGFNSHKIPSLTSFKLNGKHWEKDGYGSRK